MNYITLILISLLVSCSSVNKSPQLTSEQAELNPQQTLSEQNNPTPVQLSSDEELQKRMKELKALEKYNQEQEKILGDDKEYYSKVKLADTQKKKGKHKKDKVTLVKSSSNKVMVEQLLDYHCIKFEGKVYKDSETCAETTKELLIKCKKKVGLEQFDLLSCLRKEFMRASRKNANSSI